MPRTDRLPETLSASFGIVTSIASSVAASVAEEVRKGPRAALKLPLMAMTTGAAVSQRVRQDLSTGAQLLRTRFAADDLQEPFVSAFDRVTEDTRDLVVAASSLLGRNGHAGAPHVPRSDQPDQADDPAPKAAPPSTAPASAAPPSAPAAAERVGLRPPEPKITPEVAAAAGPVVDHDKLPLPDFDHMTIGQLRGRLRSLDLVSLVQLRDYEQAHAHRLPIVTMLDNRIAKVKAPDADSGSPQTTSSGASGNTPTGSPVTPATAGPPIHSPSHGAQGNLTQP